MHEARSTQGPAGATVRTRTVSGLVAMMAIGWTALASADAGGNYVGAQRCKGCHLFEYEVWAAGPHANTHRSLEKKQLADAKCNSCHTMLPGSTKERFVAVQCERCHGPGKYYHPDYVMKDRDLARAVGLVDPKPEHCAACHTEGTPSIRPFDYARMWAEIDHGPQARKRWEAARVGSKSSEP